MNRLLAGLPGGGKSYHAVKLIKEFLQQARVVVTNIKVKEKEIEKLDLPGKLIYLDNEQLDGGDFFFEYPGAVFVLDEVRRWLPSGMQQKDLPDGFDKLLSEHRHYEDWRGRSSEVILISQCGSQLPRCVRTLIDQTTILTKLNKVGLKNRYVARVYTGPQSLIEVRKGDLINSFRGKYDPAICKLYESHSKKRSALGTFEEEGDSGSANILKGFQAKLVYLAAIAGVIAISFLILSLGQKNDVTAQEQLPAQEQTPIPEQKPRAEQTTTEKDKKQKPIEKKPTENKLPELSGYWLFGERCGAYDISGRLLEILDCQRLNGKRIATSQNVRQASQPTEILNLITP